MGIDARIPLQARGPNIKSQAQAYGEQMDLRAQEQRYGLNEQSYEMNEMAIQKAREDEEYRASEEAQRKKELEMQEAELKVRKAIADMEDAEVDRGLKETEIEATILGPWLHKDRTQQADSYMDLIDQLEAKKILSKREAAEARNTPYDDEVVQEIMAKYQQSSQFREMAKEMRVAKRAKEAAKELKDTPKGDFQKEYLPGWLEEHNLTRKTATKKDRKDAFTEFKKEARGSRLLTEEEEEQQIRMRNETRATPARDRPPTDLKVKEATRQFDRDKDKNEKEAVSKKKKVLEDAGGTKMFGETFRNKGSEEDEAAFQAKMAKIDEWLERANRQAEDIFHAKIKGGPGKGQEQGGPLQYTWTKERGLEDAR